MSGNSYFVHSSAIVETKKIGQNSRIWAFVHVLKEVEIGVNVNICDHCFIEDGVFIGDNVTIKSGVYLWKGLTVENNVFIGPGVVFSNDLFPRSGNRDFLLKKINLKTGCSLGANSTILAGVSIGKYAMIGAGSVVTKNVEDYQLIYGNPAIARGWVCKCGKKINFSTDIYTCQCGQRFEKKSDKLTCLG